jgi:hypothetical protein
MANNISSNIKNWSATLASNQPDGSDSFASLPDDLRAIQAGVRAWYESSEWTDLGHTPTRTSGTTFTIPGDQTAYYVAGQGIKCTDGASTFYGVITTVAYTSLTTITVALDSGALTSSLSAVAVGPDNSNGAIRVGVTPSLGDSSNKLATTGFVTNTAFSGQLPAQTGNNGKFLTTDGTVASWAQASLTTGVTGTLPVANGGTGATTLTGIVIGNGAGACTSAVSGTDVKTINGTSIMGSGNILTGTRSQFTASGSISAAGLPLALKTDGKVAAIGSYFQPNVAFNSANHSGTVACYDATTNTVAVAYVASNQLYCVIGSISGGNISFATPVSIAAVHATYQNTAICSQSGAGKIVVVYSASSTGYPQAVVGTISGGTVTFGSPVAIAGTLANSPKHSVIWDSTNNRLSYLVGTGSQLYGHCGTISGSSTTWGTNATLSAVGVASYAQCFDATNGKVHVIYEKSGTTYYQVCSVAGTTFTLGTEASVYSGASQYISCCWDSTNQRLVAAFVVSADYNGRCIVGSVSGTTVTWGTAVTFSVNATATVSLDFDATDGKVLIGYSYNDSPYYVKAVTGTVSGTTISYGTAANVSDSGYASVGAMSLVYSSGSGAAIVVYKGASNYGYGRLAVMVSGDFSFTSTNFIGLSESSAADAATLYVTTMGGINAGVSGLSTGFTYYVDSSGTLTTTASGNTLVGKALSATSLLVTGG